jgi:hypothetical protein
MKLLKKVVIAGKEYKILKDSTRSEGRFDGNACTITIGTSREAEVLTPFFT